MPILSLILFLCNILYAADVQVFNDDNERIMEMRLDDGTVLSRSSIVYEVGPGPIWYLPLGELSDNLGFALQVTPHYGKAVGYFLSETRRFLLDTTACTVKIENKQDKYECKQAVPRGEDIYVDSRALEKWFPLKIKVDTYRSLIVVTALEKLPEQLRREREALLMTTKAQAMTYDSGFQKIETPNQAFTLPFLDQQLLFSRQFSPEGNTNRFQHTTEIGNEIMGFESYGYLLGTEKRIEQWQASFAKRDADGKMLGPLHATEARFLYLNMPPMPLISEGKSGRGFLLSNYPLNAPSNYGMQNFEGPLTQGWEVELYRNGFLIDRQVSNQSGRYVFRNIPLQYGRNQFRLDFFGPRGERKSQYQTFYIDPSIVRPDSHDFRGGFAVLNDDRRRLSFQYEQNIMGNLSLGTGILHDENPAKSYGYVGGTSFLGPVLVAANIAASDEGYAYDLNAQTGYKSVTLGGKHSRFMGGYASELFVPPGSVKLDNITSGNLSYILPLPISLAMTWDMSARNYVDATKQTILKNLISTNTGPFFWNHEFDYFFDSTVPFRGKLDLSVLPYQSHIRLGVEYTQDGFRYVETEAIQRIQDSYALSVLLRRQLKENIWQARSTATKLFGFGSLGLDFALNSPGNFSTGILFTYSIGFDARDNTPYIQRDPEVPFGSAAILVFKDLNHNRKWDKGEPPIKGIALKVNQRETELSTNEEGKILLSRLPANLPVDLSLAEQSFTDPFLRPAIKGVRITPRASSAFPLELPIATVGEVDGYVQIEQNKKLKPKRGVVMELVAKDGMIVSTQRTDSDGFYIFDSVVPDEYSVRVSPTQNAKFKNITPLANKVRVKDEGSFESHNDFILVQ